MRISDWSSDVCSSDLVVKNTIKDFSEQNAYLRNFYGLSNTREKYKAFGGIRGSFSSSEGFKAQFEIANVGQQNLIITDPTNVRKSAVYNKGEKGKRNKIKAELTLRNYETFRRNTEN